MELFERAVIYYILLLLTILFCFSVFFSAKFILEYFKDGNYIMSVFFLHGFVFECFLWALFIKKVRGYLK